MKSVARLESIVKNLSSVSGNTCTQQWRGREWSLRSCMEDVKYDSFEGSWIKPPKNCKTFPAITQLKQYKATLNRMVGYKLAVKYDSLALYIPKSLSPMQRYTVLCQWRAIWHRPGYVYLFNHYVENGIDPFDTMFILQSNYDQWTNAGFINMPLPRSYMHSYDTSILTRWKQAWQHDELVNIESSTCSIGGKSVKIKDVYDIEGSVKPFIKANSGTVPTTEEVFHLPIGGEVKTTLAGLSMTVEIMEIKKISEINPYRADVKCKRLPIEDVFYIPMWNFDKNRIA